MTNKFSKIDILEQKAANGDLDAQGHLINMFRDYAIRFVQKKISISYHDAEDAVQNASCSILATNQYDGSTRFVTYFSHFVKNRSLDIMRKFSQRKDCVVNESLVKAKNPLSLNNNFFAEILREKIREAHTKSDIFFSESFNNLSLNHKEVLTLFFVHNLSHKQISYHLKINMNTIKTRKHAALKDLIERLKDNNDYDCD